jgi:hypothetical protein
MLDLCGKRRTSTDSGSLKRDASGTILSSLSLRNPDADMKNISHPVKE